MQRITTIFVAICSGGYRVSLAYFPSIILSPNIIFFILYTVSVIYVLWYPELQRNSLSQHNIMVCMDSFSVHKKSICQSTKSTHKIFFCFINILPLTIIMIKKMIPVTKEKLMVTALLMTKINLDFCFQVIILVWDLYLFLFQ